MCPALLENNEEQIECEQCRKSACAFQEDLIQEREWEGEYRECTWSIYPLEHSMGWIARSDIASYAYQFNPHNCHMEQGHEGWPSFEQILKKLKASIDKHLDKQ